MFPWRRVATLVTFEFWTCYCMIINLQDAVLNPRDHKAKAIVVQRFCHTACCYMNSTGFVLQGTAHSKWQLWSSTVFQQAAQMRLSQNNYSHSVSEVISDAVFTRLQNLHSLFNEPLTNHFPDATSLIWNSFPLVVTWALAPELERMPSQTVFSSWPQTVNCCCCNSMHCSGRKKFQGTKV